MGLFRDRRRTRQGYVDAQDLDVGRDVQGAIRIEKWAKVMGLGEMSLDELNKLRLVYIRNPLLHGKFWPFRRSYDEQLEAINLYAERKKNPIPEFHYPREL